MRHYVYHILHLETGRKYYGATAKPEQRFKEHLSGYLGTRKEIICNPGLKRDTTSEDQLQFEVLHEFETQEQAREKELELIKSDPVCYNSVDGLCEPLAVRLSRRLRQVNIISSYSAYRRRIYAMVKIDTDIYTLILRTHFLELHYPKNATERAIYNLLLELDGQVFVQVLHSDDFIGNRKAAEDRFMTALNEAAKIANFHLPSFICRNEALSYLEARKSRKLTLLTKQSA